jgi:2-polyprenyl-3-methyl-5-hydroxy-6-metoxy-1,4-benzoquinol methylase
MNSETILKADSVKPKYDKVKEVWNQMLSEYFENGVLKAEFALEVPCPYCKSKKAHSPFTINGFNHMTCNECDVVYVNPRLKDECLERLYNNAYYSEMYAKSMIPVFEMRKKLIGERKTKQTLGFVSKATSPQLDVLDIGCGVGEVIDAFKDLKHNCSAIEVNPVAVDWLRQKGITVFADAFDRFPETEKFDVIMAWGVVEHVVNPHEFLQKVYRHLKPGGIFASEVPSGQCLTVDHTRNTLKDPIRIIMGEQHIILYSLKAYEAIHAQAGLEKVHVQTNGLDVETILKINNEKVADSVVFEMQKCVDSYGKGDLIRGFWRKPLS